MENATRAWDMGVYGYPFRPGDRVLTGRSEYASNVIALLQLSARHGVEIAVIEDDEHGQISLEHLRSELEAGAAMVALTHVPTNGGLVNPAEAVGDLCAEFGVFYVLDACQSAGQIPVDVTKVGCDLLSATGRKYLRGPRGTGFLYVSERALETITPPFLDLHAATWTASKRLSGSQRCTPIRELGDELRRKARAGVQQSTTHWRWGSTQRARIMVSAALLRLKLESTVSSRPTRDWRNAASSPLSSKASRPDRVQTESPSGGSTCRPRLPLTAPLDLPHRGLDAVVRASVHYYNSEDEIERLCAALRNLP
ncbi:MAG: aminotransferase class V-fold PLP-dependent enzyme [Microthrixaceae bacterium]